MRCYFMRGGHIAAVELLDAKSDEEAMEQCRGLFEERKSKFEGFEVWDRTRKIAEGAPREGDANEVAGCHPARQSEAAAQYQGSATSA